MYLIILLVILVILLSCSYYAYRVAFYVPAQHKADPYTLLDGEQYQAVGDLIHAATRAMEKHQFEPVTITADDGVKLFGRFYFHTEGAPLQILFHGYRSCALRDCCGGHALAWKMGFNTLVVDQRAHGESGGRAITFGIKERFDCLAWIRYALLRCGQETKIVLTGLSMGAATVLAASELDLPENVVCIIADSPYASPESIIRKVCRDDKLPDKLAYPFVKLGARIFAGFNIDESSPIEAVKQAKVPILLLHGEDDRFVPCTMSEDIRQSCASPAVLRTFPYAGHGLAYMIDPVGYEEAVYDFLRAIPALTGLIQGNPVKGPEST